MVKQGNFYQNLGNGISDRISKIFTNPYSEVNLNWLKLKILKHLPANKIHHHLLLGHQTYYLGGPEYLHGLKEIFLEGVYLQDLPANAHILDCGAHIGLSIIYLKNICPTAKITAFEPDIENFKLLEKNIKSHHLDNVNLLQKAVWNENTTINFRQEGNMSSRIVDSLSSNTLSVQAVRLRDYIGDNIEFLKLDIEGAEYRVLRDIKDTLSRVSKLFIEYHGSFDQNEELIEIFEMVNKAGYKFYIKEAANNFSHPFLRNHANPDYDIQLNIFCFR
jgi:FkbM family methyltransferase